MVEINKYIDFNCNLSELSQFQPEEKESEIIELISSANISCGIHQSNPLEIKRIIEKCKFKNKVIGASVGLPIDIITTETMSAEDIEAVILYQIGAVSAFTKANSMNIEYVRPDGLLYKTISANEDLALKVAKAIEKYSKWLLLYLPSGEITKKITAETNLNLVKEINLNSSYNSDGSLNFDNEPLKDNGLQLIRLRRLMNLGEIEVSELNYVKFEFDSIHFDSKIENLAELLKEAKNIVAPRPVNYNNVAETGWVSINRNHYLQENTFEKNNK